MPFVFPKEEDIECKLVYCSKAVHKQATSPHSRKLFCTSCRYRIPNILIQSLQELQAPVCTAGIVKPDWGHILVTSFQNTQEKWRSGALGCCLPRKSSGSAKANKRAQHSRSLYPSPTFLFPLACRSTALSCPVPLPSLAMLPSFPSLSSQLCRIALLAILPRILWLLYCRFTFISSRTISCIKICLITWKAVCGGISKAALSS